MGWGIIDDVKAWVSEPGKQFLRVLAKIDPDSLPLDIEGDFSPSGLTIAGKITTMDVGDTATAIPATPQTNRNTIGIRNLSEVDTLYVGFSSSVTADRALGTDAGWEVGPGEDFPVDIKDTIILYGICESGKTIRLKVLEMA